MKTLIKLFITILLTIIFNVSAFAESKTEFILNIPIGASYSIISQTMKDYGMENYFDFNAGVNVQFGGMFQIKEGFGISILGDIGYLHDNYKITYERNYDTRDYRFSYDSIQVGLLSKFNMKGFSIGIGGGIKFPIYEDSRYNYAISSVSYSVQPNPNYENNTSGENVEQWVDYVYMYGENMVYKPYYVIPYAKLTLDYSIFLNQKWALNIGLYLRYDFLPEQSIYYYNSNYGLGAYYGYIDKPKNYGTLNFGVQLGFRFGPRV